MAGIIHEVCFMVKGHMRTRLRRPFRTPLLTEVTVSGVNAVNASKSAIPAPSGDDDCVRKKWTDPDALSRY